MEATQNIEEDFDDAYRSLLHFMGKPLQRGYIFAMADDQRFIPQINSSLVKDLQAKGISTAILFLQPESDEPLFYQIRKVADGHGALIIANIYTIVDNTKEGVDRLVELNFARESFWELGIPVLFWCDKRSMNLVSNKAPDLFSQRRLSTIHFTGTMDNHVQEQITGPDREAYIDSEKFKELEAETQMLERRLASAKAAGYHIARTVSEIALPLARAYAEMGMREQAEGLLDGYGEYLSAPENEEILEQLAMIYKLLHNYDLAIVTLQKADKLLTNDDYKASDGDLHIKFNHAFIQGLLGEVYQIVGRLTESLSCYKIYNQLIGEICNVSSSNTSYKLLFAISHEKLGSVYELMGNFSKGLKCYEAEVALFKQLHNANPRDVSFKNGLAISYEKLGSVYEQMGDFPKALEYYEKGIELTKSLHDANPNDLAFKNGLAISYEKLGGLFEQIGDLQKAQLYFENEVYLLEELRRSNPRDVQLKNNLAIAHGKLGGVFEQFGNLQMANNYYNKVSVVFESLKEASPGNSSYSSNLATIYYRLGAVYEKQNQTEKAKQKYQIARLLWEEIVAITPEIAEIKKNLMEVTNKLNSMV